MPGGWTLSAASFLGMWAVMTAAMMLPSVALMLWRYREAIGVTGATRFGLLSMFAGGGRVARVVGGAAAGFGVLLIARAALTRTALRQSASTSLRSLFAQYS
jgi:predicted metal-binding membrane protein